MSKTKEKKDGVIYTPAPVVEKMLDMVGYFPEKTPGFFESSFMDNSCGDGNILAVALERACEALDKTASVLGFTPEGKYNFFQYRLVPHFHGMEINEGECAKCVRRMNSIVSTYLCRPIDWNWDIRCGNSLANQESGCYDFVVCNPPYIRTHDLEYSLEGYKFTEDGMKDMYLAFYELGLRQVSRDGKICYITPSSWFTSTAGKKLRKYLYDNNLLSEIYDYGHTQVFENATTYVAITVMDMLNPRIDNDRVLYGGVELGDTKISIPYQDIMIDGRFYFGQRLDLDIIKKVDYSHKGTIKVKNGYATTADDVFIVGDTPWPTGGSVIPVVKSSTGKMCACIYPYDKNGKLYPEETLREKSPMEYKWLCSHRERLETRKTEEPWYAFGRTQAIGDTYKDKWAVKSVVKSLGDIMPVKASAGIGVYGGLYILCDGPEQLECLKTKEFMSYVKSLRKYKSGGYYTFSSKDLENYLNWYNFNREK